MKHGSVELAINVSAVKQEKKKNRKTQKKHKKKSYEEQLRRSDWYWE